MSDYRAIAGVTTALQQLLNGPVSAAVPGASVRAGPPTRDPLAGASGLVNLFLYQISPNASWRNAELPVRDGSGRLLRRPQAAFDLHYLLSFYGDETRLVPQLLLGATVSALHAQPSLTPDDIPDTLEGKDLRDSGLRDQARLLQMVPIPMTHEEISKLWSIFFQIPFALSIAYRCQVVLIEPSLTPTAALSLPVSALHLGAAPWRQPSIERITPQMVEVGPGAKIRVEGDDLGGDGVVARFGEIDVTPLRASDRELEVELPEGLACGVRTVRVLHRGSGGAAAEPRRSNPAPFVLLPRIAGPVAVADGRLRVPVEPPVAADARAELVLNERSSSSAGSPRSYRLRSVEGAAGSPVEFAAAEVRPGDYLVRLEVNGASSRLATETDPSSPDFGRYNGPRVVLS